MRARTSPNQRTRSNSGLRGPCIEQADVLQEDHEGHEELHLKYQVSIKYKCTVPV
jgi:hypothetical protein